MSFMPEQGIRSRSRLVPQIRVRTRQRLAECVDVLSRPIITAWRWNTARYGDPRKLLWDILAQHRSLSGLRAGCTMIYSDTEEEAISLYETTNPDYEVIGIGLISDIMNRVGLL